MSKKHRHVVRSTFAAELFNAADTAEVAILIRTALHEIEHGVTSTDTMRKLVTDGGFTMPAHLIIDAKSVQDAVTAAHVKPPAEKPLLLQVQWLREQLDRQVLTTIIWLDTRDMLADGMTKGSVDRKQIRAAMNGIVSFLQDFKALKTKRVLKATH